MPSIKAFAGVARAPFLLLPVTLVAAGAAAAAYTGSFSWLRTVVALVGLIALHIAVDAFNEWSDMKTGIDLKTQRTPFSGGSGTLPAGEMSTRAAFWFGVVTAAIGLAAGIWFYSKIGWPIIPFMIIGAIFVVGYTDGLARIGVGELAAGLGLGGLPVVGVALVQSGVIPEAAVWAGIPATLTTFNLLLLNEFPDEAADREGGRQNIVLMLGRPAAALVYAIAALLTPASIILAVTLGKLPLLALVAVLPSLLLLAKPLGWAFQHAADAVPVPAMGSNVVWNLSTNVVLAGALIVATVL
jgi:1,4-dihydroxy-2-naphthoate octaprenyltransferase